MKKLLLVTTVLFGTMAASQAGVSFHIGLDLPLPLPVPVIISHRAPVVVSTRPACPPYVVISARAPICVTPPQVVLAAPPCEVAPVMIAPRPVYYYPSYYRGYEGYGGHYNRGYSHGYRH